MNEYFESTLSGGLQYWICLRCGASLIEAYDRNADVCFIDPRPIHDAWHDENDNSEVE